MKKRSLCFLLCLILLLSLSGCSLDMKEKLYETGLLEKPKEPDYSVCSGELDAVMVDFPTYTGYYIYRQGKYYCMQIPSWYQDKDYAEKKYNQNLEKLTLTGRRCALRSWQDIKIPTLYLEEGDELIYYSGQNILNYYTFTKLMDLGWSVPITNFYTTVGGYVYVNVDKEKEESPYTCTLLPSDIKDTILNFPMYQEQKDVSASIRFYTINGTEFLSEYIHDNIIQGLKRDEKYQFNTSFGTLDYQFVTTADYHFFQECELYAEANYDSAYDNIYHIPIPEYLTSGYYMMSDGEIFRFMREGTTFDLYNEEDSQFNQRICNLDEEFSLANGGYYNEETRHYVDANGNPVANSYQAYSSNPKLNYYHTNVPGALGYVSSGTQLAEGETKTQEPEPEVIEETRVSYFVLQKANEEAKSVSVTKDTVLYYLTSSLDTSPCMVSQYWKGDMETLSVEMTEDAYTYTYHPTEDCKIKDPIYIALYYTTDSTLRFKGKDSRFLLKQITEEEVPEALRTQKEEIKRY